MMETTLFFLLVIKAQGLRERLSPAVDACRPRERRWFVPWLPRGHGWDAPVLSQLPRGPQHPAAIIADSDSLTVDTGRRLQPGLALLRPVPQGREFGLKRKSCSEHVLDTGGDTNTPAQPLPPPNFSFCAFAQDFLCGMPGPICSRKFLPVFSFFEIEIEIIHTL